MNLIKIYLHIHGLELVEIAEILFTPDNIDRAISFIKEKPKDLKIFTIGAGSNILIRDNGIRGVSLLQKN